jgi:hypothetical protein
MTRADEREPVHVSRTGRVYQPGIGPHAEDLAVRLTLDELRRMPKYAGMQFGQALPYPRAPRQRCDVWIGQPVEWAIEVKMARFRGDNGKPDDTSIKDLLSPYDKDRSALPALLHLPPGGSRTPAAPGQALTTRRPVAPRGGVGSVKGVRHLRKGTLR